MISVVVVFHSDLLALENTLASLTGQCDELLVVDVSPHGIAGVVAGSHGASTISAIENRGYGWACNLGIANSTGEQILVSNADVTYRDGSVRFLAQTASDCHGLIAPIQFDDSSVELTRARDTLQLGISPGAALVRWLGIGRGRVERLKLRTLEEGTTAEVIAVPGDLTLSGASVMATATDWSTIGGFDESFFLYHEDAEISLRTRELGLGTWIDSRAHVTHSSGSNRAGASRFAILEAAMSERIAWRKRGFRLTGLVVLQCTGSGIRLVRALFIRDMATVRVWFEVLATLMFRRGRA